MSRRISLKKLGEKVKKSKSGGSVVGPSPAKGVVIGEKCPRKGPSSSPSKKGKTIDRPKGKEVNSVPEPKRKTTKDGDATCSRAPLSQSAGKGTVL